jgi:rod shape-determining protein MreD
MNGRQVNRIGRRRHILHVRGTPAATVLIGSLLPAILPVIAQAPLLPPVGLMAFIAWRLLRPDIWPLWIGLPFGLFDDLMGGQPLGSAVLLWTLVLLGMELEGRRHFWRDYWHDWLVGGIALLFTILGGWTFVRVSGFGGPAFLLLPQMAYSIALFPLMVRICAMLDRWRLP